MTADTLFVTGAVLVAALGLGVRAWRRAKRKYEAGPCCGGGCGCVKPVVFGAKKKKSKH